MHNFYEVILTGWSSGPIHYLHLASYPTRDQLISLLLSQFLNLKPFNLGCKDIRIEKNRGFPFLRFHHDGVGKCIGISSIRLRLFSSSSKLETYLTSEHSKIRELVKRELS